MEVLGYLLCVLAGAGIVLAVQRVERPREERPETPPPKLNRQYKNLWNYDGTERGQEELED